MNKEERKEITVVEFFKKGVTKRKETYYHLILGKNKHLVFQEEYRKNGFLDSLQKIDKISRKDKVSVDWVTVINSQGKRLKFIKNIKILVQ